MKRLRSITALVPLFVALAVALAPSPSQASVCGAWATAASPNQNADHNELLGVTALSATNAWAVGLYFDGTSDRTLIEHYDGTSWTVVPSPNNGDLHNQLNSVSAVSASNVWAVGYYYNGSSDRTLVEHWNGSSWSVVNSPDNGSDHNELDSVATSAKGGGWAVGFFFDTTAQHDRTLILHLHSGKWSVVASPNGASNHNELSGAARVGKAGFWAVGRYESGDPNTTGRDQTLVERWNGTAWVKVPSPNVTGTGSVMLHNELDAAAGTGKLDLWAVGNYNNGTTPTNGTFQNLIEHWNGTAWSVVNSPDAGSNTHNQLNGVAALTSSNAYAVGYYFDGTADQTLVLHWNGTAWSIMGSPNVGTEQHNELDAATRVPGSTTSAWAVGFHFNGTTPTNGSDRTLVQSIC